MTLVFVRHSVRRRHGADLTVTIHYPLAGHDAHTFMMYTTEPACAVCADELQALYDKRDATIEAALSDESNAGTYIGFRAHDPEAERISLAGLFRYGSPDVLPRAQRHALDAKLGGLPWYQEEREVIGPWAWVIGFHGLLIDRVELPGVIAKLRRVAGGTL